MLIEAFAGAEDTIHLLAEAKRDFCDGLGAVYPELEKPY